MNVGKYYRYVFCSCGAVYGEKHMLDVCRECGANRSTFEPHVARRIETGVWWKPSTWDTFHYEKLEKTEPDIEQAQS